MRARTVLIGLRPFYAMYMLHGLFMPDTPGLAALRALIDERGMGRSSTRSSRSARRPASSPKA
ncbi:hypothetical protein ABZX28_33150 [Streptomyces rubiginosohelvolus]|uniref:hypothetical protein n=1 Tax=Streptomyces rubiginosohelvolus TaxID=67362 RepID=UPI0033B36750